MSDPKNTEIQHASSVAISDEAAVLIVGPSGAGKSSLALRLISLGGELIADDRTELRRDGEHIFGRAPDALPAALEVRGVGLLHAKLCAETRITLVVDLSKTQTERLPIPQTHAVLDVKLPCLHKVDTPDFHFAVLHYLKFGLASL